MSYQKVYFVHGNVEIDPSVAIAPGSILEAEPGCRLIVATGVCLGTDVTLQARWGDLVIEPGVSLGSGVLVVGAGRIGHRSCIGSASTLINPQILPQTTLPPRSLVEVDRVGTNGMAVPGTDRNGTEANEAVVHGSDIDGIDPTGVLVNAPPGEQPPDAILENPDEAKDASPTTGSSHVYGREQVNQLLATLFPHRQI